MNNPAHIYVAERAGQRRFAVSDGGFTLLELLISITLLVVIVAITMGAMRLGSRSVASGERKMDAQERFRTVLSFMDAQIQSQVPLTYEEDGKKRYYFSGDGKTLRFSTNYSIWGGQRGYVIVDYTVKADNTGKEVLYAGEQVPGIEGRRDIRLIEATGISFEYFHKDRAEEQGKWLEMLSGESFIPEKVKVHIVEGTKKLFLVFPVRVGGEMMTVKSDVPIPAGL
ncbi:MAG: prepilin-type N-terminal cleavage/methylation domain-containing protein [Deltaproteobacteria bacterium]|nr:prepilin-type N-terminal cleavage/methylation domain-containing protein [Deltaproteobacteria bacterium]